MIPGVLRSFETVISDDVFGGGGCVVCNCTVDDWTGGVWNCTVDGCTGGVWNCTEDHPDCC